MAAFVPLDMGSPLLIVASAVLLALYGIVPMARVGRATDPLVFRFVFHIFAQNLKPWPPGSAPERRPLDQVDQFLAQKDDMPGAEDPDVDSNDGSKEQAQRQGDAIGHGPSANENARPAIAGRASRLKGAVAQAFRRPMTTARSAMRTENPHSLSYHASTRTRRPSITRVWSGAKIELSSVWLKSIDTSGAGS